MKWTQCDCIRYMFLLLKLWKYYDCRLLYLWTTENQDPHDFQFETKTEAGVVYFVPTQITAIHLSSTDSGLKNPDGCNR